MRLQGERKRGSGNAAVSLVSKNIQIIPEARSGRGEWHLKIKQIVLFLAQLQQLIYFAFLIQPEHYYFVQLTLNIALFCSDASLV